MVSTWEKTNKKTQKLQQKTTLLSYFWFSSFLVYTSPSLLLLLLFMMKTSSETESKTPYQLKYALRHDASVSLPQSVPLINLSFSPRASVTSQNFGCILVHSDVLVSLQFGPPLRMVSLITTLWSRHRSKASSL